MSEKDPEGKRPDHFDFMDFYELRRAKFSGIRSNSVSGEVEIWIEGEIKKTVSKEALAYNPEAAVANALEDVFMLDDISMEVPDAFKLQ